MTQASFFLRTALNHLRRGGQRALVALLCVTFGVMSLTAMLLLSGTLENLLVRQPHDMVGADISMERAADGAILPEHVTALEALRAAGVLERYTLVGYTASLALRLPGSGELHFPGAGIGIDPAAYPPIGALTVAGAGSAGLPTLLAGPGDVLISNDLALAHHLAVGDRLALSDLTVGAALDATVRGIVTDTPNHKGSKLYYNLETAQILAGGSHALNTALVTSADPAAAAQRLKAGGWRVFVAADLAYQDSQTQAFLAAMLNGAGVLGLLVGGVGIANTMQVLMRRRQREIAIWKSLGYRGGHMLALFGLEAGLLGLAGSLLGAGLGVALAQRLLDLFTRTSTMLVRWTVRYDALLLAVLAGTATTLIFALWAIVRSSRARPLALLRSEALSPSALPWPAALALLLALAAPFLAVIRLIMGSWLHAALVLLLALAGLVGLGGGLALLLRAVLWLLPLRSLPLFHMARGSLRRRGLSPVFALVALFIGVVTLTLAAVVTQNASAIDEAAALDVQGPNLSVLAPAAEESAVLRAVQARAPESVSVGYDTPVRSIMAEGAPGEAFAPLLVARSQPDAYTLRGAAWGSRPDGVYVSTFSALPEGSRLVVTLWDGAQRSLPVVGTYAVDFNTLFRPELGVLLPVELSRSLAAPAQARVMARFAPARLSAAAAGLGADLPGMTVVNHVAYAARFTRAYHDLFLLAVSMAGLALLAGALLMANAVSLAVLDRRYEIGVLKAMGYTRGHVLVTLVVEYAIIAAVACAAGLGVVRAFLWLVGINNPLAANLLRLTPAAAGAVTLAALGLTLLTVLAATSKPTRVSPLVVLNDRE